MKLSSASLVLWLAAGCQTGAEISVAGDRDGGSAPGHGDAPTLPPNLPPTIGPGFPDAAAPPATMPPPDKCAEEAHMAERVPVDLLLLIDRSGSMNTKTASGKSKWQLAQEALTAFIGDPKSDGLGVGMEFFPVQGDGRCTTDVDCGLPRDVGQFCVPRRACAGPAGPTSLLCGSAFDDPCPAGTTCVPLGRCSMGGADCVGIGRACPAGPAGNTCLDGGKICAFGILDSCKTADYARPTVPIADLPGARPALTAALMSTATGGTPTDPAVAGALGQLRMRVTAQPDRRAALILLTDGVPGGCGTADPVETVNTLVTMARATAPSIATYVIGVFGAVETMGGERAVTRWAMSGGTGMPFILTPTDDLSQRLLDALNQIRGSALACEYKIPPARMGGAIDFKKLNLHFKGMTGEEDIGYVGRADRCDPMRGGWYYDVDPEMGMPTRVIVCAATCRRFQGDATGRVELRFGCKTREIE